MAPTLKLTIFLSTVNTTPTVELNALAMKRGEPTIYTMLSQPMTTYFHPQTYPMNYYSRNVYQVQYSRYLRMLLDSSEVDQFFIICSVYSPGRCITTTRTMISRPQTATRTPEINTITRCVLKVSVFFLFYRDDHLE